MGHPWEIVRQDICYPIKFFGKTVETYDGKKQWVGGEDIRAVAYDVPIPGYRTKNTICLRLWSTKVCPECLDLNAFNAGEYDAACALQNSAARVSLIRSYLTHTYYLHVLPLHASSSSTISNNWWWCEDRRPYLVIWLWCFVKVTSLFWVSQLMWCAIVCVARQWPCRPWH